MSEQLVPEVKTTQQEPEQKHRNITVNAMQVIWLALGVVVVLIGLRIVLKLIGADPGNGFVSSLYEITNPAILPFAGLISDPVMKGTFLELPALAAMVVYVLLAGILAKLVEVIFYRPIFWWVRPRTPAVNRVSTNQMLK